MINWTDTVVSQYKNSPTILYLLEALNNAVDPSENIDTFYSLVWNLDTAQGWGLDVWGRIVGVERTLKVTSFEDFFGFTEAADDEGFGQAPFWNEVPATDVYQLSDTAYRVLILVKAMRNIARTDSKSINAILMAMFAGRGNTYVTDTGAMSSRFNFEFQLTPVEVAIIQQSGCLPRSAGVKLAAMQTDPAGEFGFGEAADSEGFGQGTFFVGLIAVA